MEKRSVVTVKEPTVLTKNPCMEVQLTSLMKEIGPSLDESLKLLETELEDGGIKDEAWAEATAVEEAKGRCVAVIHAQVANASKRLKAHLEGVKFGFDRPATVSVNVRGVKSDYTASGNTSGLVFQDMEVLKCKVFLNAMTMEWGRELTFTYKFFDPVNYVAYEIPGIKLDCLSAVGVAQMKRYIVESFEGENFFGGASQSSGLAAMSVFVESEIKILKDIKMREIEAQQAVPDFVEYERVHKNRGQWS